MEAGVEARVPFLDHRLVEWGICIPSNYKCKKGIGKHILKMAATELVPQDVLVRKKVDLDFRILGGITRS